MIIEYALATAMATRLIDRTPLCTPGNIIFSSMPVYEEQYESENVELRGIYLNGTETIVIQPDLPPHIRTNVILHEAIHYNQDRFEWDITHDEVRRMANYITGHHMAYKYTDKFDLLLSKLNCE